MEAPAAKVVAAGQVKINGALHKEVAAIEAHDISFHGGECSVGLQWQTWPDAKGIKP